jgi:Asp-tRNA(Asn)/Glu-tRNA(Gln) amidotransferase A subunit family amidase
MVPLALGTQTQGSVLRPASFCGVTGFKPTYGLVPMDGVLPFAESLDTLGFFTATPADMLAFWDAFTLGGRVPPVVDGIVGRVPPAVSEIVGRVPPAAPEIVGRVPPAAGGPRPADPPNIFGVPDPLPDVEPAMASAFQDAVARLRGAGLRTEPLELGDMLARLNEASRVVMAYEAARFHRSRYEEYGDRLAHLADLVREGLKTGEDRYQEARAEITTSQARMSEVYKTVSLILVPAATGPAPFSLASTGDPRMNAPWTALGTPAVSIPLATGDGLPLGLQLTADRGDDRRLLRVAVHVGAVLKV